MGPVPTAPTYVISNPVLGDPVQGMVQCVDPDDGQFPVLFHAQSGDLHVPSIGQPRVVYLEQEASVHDGLVLLFDRVCDGV